MASSANDQELLLFIDWLGLSVRLQGEPRPLPGYIWKEYSATNVWGKRRVLWTEEGDRVLTLLSEPRNSLLDKNAGLVEVENEWLYHGGGADAILAKLLESINYEILGLSRLDLCVDFNPTESQKDIIMGLAQDRYYVGGKRSGSGFWSTNTCEKLCKDWLYKKIPHSQSWGHKTSEIKWKLYYKTRELYEAGGWKFAHKPYIIDQWRIHGLDTSNVWRLEVSCKHLNNTQLYGERVDLGVISRDRASFWVSLYLQRFKVRCNSGHKDRTNDREIEFLPVPKIPKGVDKAPSKRLAEHQGRITLLRHLVASLDDEHVLLDQPSRYTVFQAIADIVQRDALDNYFHAMTGYYVDEFIAAKDDEATKQWESELQLGNVLSIAEKGSTASERRYDMPKYKQQGEYRPNLQFEERQGESLTWEKSDAAKKEDEEVQKRVDHLVEGMQKKTPPPEWTLPFEESPFDL